MKIKFAEMQDADKIMEWDKWISEKVLRDKITRREVYVAYEETKFVGWMRYHLFWDNVPFLSMLHLLPQYRGQGLGRLMMERWETDMKELGYHRVLLSTSQEERAQRFYNRLGYHAVGSFLLPEEPLELIFMKELGESSM